MSQFAAGSSVAMAIDIDDSSVDDSSVSLKIAKRRRNHKRSIGEAAAVAVFNQGDRGGDKNNKRVRTGEHSSDERRSSTGSTSLGCGDAIRAFCARSPPHPFNKGLAVPRAAVPAAEEEAPPPQAAAALAKHHLQVITVLASSKRVAIPLIPQQPQTKGGAEPPYSSKRISMSPPEKSAIAPPQPKAFAIPASFPKSTVPGVSRKEPLASRRASASTATFCGTSSDAATVLEQQLMVTTNSDEVSSSIKFKSRLGKEEKSGRVTVDRAARFLQLLVPAFVIAAVIAFPVMSSKQQQPNHRNNHGQIPTSNAFSWQWWGISGDDLGKRVASSTATTVTMALPKGAKPLTLRDVLMDNATGFHLAMAPAFFGFYGLFGALAAWSDAAMDNDNNAVSSDPLSSLLPVKSVAGSSAGAMAAILLAAGIPPAQAADFCAGMTVGKFADFPGFGAFFRGNKFEGIMHDFLQTTSTTTNNNSAPVVLNMEDAILPVAVTAFDLQTMQGKILTTGSMARAARASATFPVLFQPVGWDDGENDYIFIDGGIADSAGMMGLTKTMMMAPRADGGIGKQTIERVINLCVGSFLQSPPPGPSSLPGNPEVFSISLQGLPQPGPWAMQNGQLAFEAARKAMTAALDSPLKPVAKKRGNKKGSNAGSEAEIHYELVIVAS